MVEGKPRDRKPASIGDQDTRFEKAAGAVGFPSVGDESSIAESAAGAGTREEPTGSGELIHGRLALLEPLGEGGMGVVWKARDIRLHRFVAIKRPKRAIVNNPQVRDRFLREASSAAGMAHPNIITVYSVGEDDDGPFIEMEYVDGRSLREAVREDGPLGEARVREIMAALCDALTLAHTRKIIHRDIKPANILLTSSGVPKLGDFGLAAVAREDEDQHSLTATGTFLGTPFYASPEQRRGGAIDARSDIYSLAATAFYLLTGDDPHINWPDCLAQELKPVLARALEQEPAKRYPDMRALGRAFTIPALGAAARRDSGLCPTCGQDNPLSARHCTHCGASLKELYRPCQTCGIENRIDQKFCQGCGANLEVQRELENLQRAIRQHEEEYLFAELVALAERGLELAPGDELFAKTLADARERLAQIEELHNQLKNLHPSRFDRRIEIMEALLRLRPTDAEAAQLLGKTQQERERYRQDLLRRQLRARRRQAIIIGLLVAGVLLALGLGFAFRSASAPSATKDSAPAVPEPTPDDSDSVPAVPTQTPTVEAPGKKVESNFTENLGHGVRLELIWIPAGSFMMGSEDGRENESPRHRVNIADFWIGKFEVTQEQYEAVTGKNPSKFQGARNPVERVSWMEAKAFCDRLTNQTGRRYRLPTEAQWEYACRAGNTGAWCFGDDQRQLDKYSWHNQGSARRTHPVGMKQPNDWGLFDMHGNVFEWCRDGYHAGYQGAPPDGSEWPEPDASLRIMRGGCWSQDLTVCRSASRSFASPNHPDATIGFRVMCGPLE